MPEQVYTRSTDDGNADRALEWMTVVEDGVDFNDVATLGVPIDISAFKTLAMEVLHVTGDEANYVIIIQASVVQGIWLDVYTSVASFEGLALPSDTLGIWAKWVRWKVTPAEGTASTGNIAFHCKR